MFKHTIACTPTRSLVDGLTSNRLDKPNYAKALKQHNAYTRALQTYSVDIILLPPDEHFPGSVSVEDSVSRISHCAIITYPDAESRHGETEIIEETVQRFHPSKIRRIEIPGTAKAGDIVMVSNHFYIGELAHINAEDAQRMIAILEEHGLNGSVVRLEKVLYLKTRLACLEHSNLPAAGKFVSKPEFQGFDIVKILKEESYAANCIWVNERVVIPAGYPRTRGKTTCPGYRVIKVDISERHKIDSDISYMSLYF